MLDGGGHLAARIGDPGFQLDRSGRGDAGLDQHVQSLKIRRAVPDAVNQRSGLMGQHGVPRRIQSGQVGTAGQQQTVALRLTRPHQGGLAGNVADIGIQSEI